MISVNLVHSATDLAYTETNIINGINRTRYSNLLATINYVNNAYQYQF